MSGPGRERWAALWQRIGASGDPSPWYGRLTAAYGEPQRQYHNQRHLAECLAEFDLARHLAVNPEVVELALWFHDAVYDPKAGDNEEQSAALADRCLTEARVPPEVTAKVSQLVLATKNHAPGADADAALMVDVDLSILGQGTERFLQYEDQIRREYAWVPEPVFNSKRAEILKGFLARSRIFKTDWFYERYERNARRNLGDSIRQLRGLSP